VDQPERQPTLEAKSVRIKTKRVIVGTDDENTTDIQPLFVNNIDVMKVGSDIYLDLGVVKPEDIILMGSNQNADFEVPLNFYVLQRVALSTETFQTLMARGAQLVPKGQEDE